VTITLPAVRIELVFLAYQAGDCRLTTPAPICREGCIELYLLLGGVPMSGGKRCLEMLNGTGNFVAIGAIVVVGAATFLQVGHGGASQLLSLESWLQAISSFLRTL
jgi:hypothetical protein